MLRRPSPTTVIALIAFGRSALAAGHSLINSTSQIRPSVLHRLHHATVECAASGAAVAASAPRPCHTRMDPRISQLGGRLSRRTATP